jgi:hypothetical protein
LHLVYEQDDEPNQTGSLEITVESRGYRATSRTYTAASSLVRFADALLMYPLPADGVRFEALDLRISVRPLGSLGHLLLVAEVESVGEKLQQKAVLQLETDYGGVDEFAKSLAAVARRAAGEASLVIIE